MSSPEAYKPPADADRYRLLLEASRRLSATLRADELYEAIYRETEAELEESGFYLALHDQSRDLARIVFYADNGRAKRVDVSYRGSDPAVLRMARCSCSGTTTARVNDVLSAADADMYEERAKRDKEKRAAR